MECEEPGVVHKAGRAIPAASRLAGEYILLQDSQHGTGRIHQGQYARLDLLQLAGYAVAGSVPVQIRNFSGLKSRMKVHEHLLSVSIVEGGCQLL